uniref:Retinoic acid receptor responder protein 2 n=1 Tax=Nothobranchius kadleci TaxID=1051664 RepID=A0A1A8C6K5_NOTKA
MAAVLLWLFSLGALLYSSGAQKNYEDLPETYRKGVDLALKMVNSLSSVQHHFLFYKSVEKSATEPGFDVSYILHHFLLRATRCQKGTVETAGCQFREDRPPIDCTVCYKTYRGEIEPEPKPYVHCIQKPALTVGMMNSRRMQCSAVGCNSGAITLLSSIGNE